MSSLVKLEFKDMPEMRVIGKPIAMKMGAGENPIPAFWDTCFADGTFKGLEALGDALIDPSYAGFMTGGADGGFTYVCGMLCKPGTLAPEGYNHWDVPACKAAVGWIQGPEKDNYAIAHCSTLEAMGAKGFVQTGWSMELYVCPRFTEPDAQGSVILDYYICCGPRA